MAKPIKETPFLKGKDAETFILDTKKPEKVSKEVKERMKENFSKFNAIAKF